jgi:hypothetical protein
VAQWIARRTSNPEAVGSSPTKVAYFIALNSAFTNHWHEYMIGQIALKIHLYNVSEVYIQFAIICFTSSLLFTGMPTHDVLPDDESLKICSKLLL